MRLLSLCMTICISSLSIAQKSLSLDECVNLAYKNNLSLQQKALTIESAESTLQQSESNRLPTLMGFATHNYNWGQRIDPFTNLFANTRVQSNSFGLSSSVTLFSGLQNERTIDARQAALSSAIYDVETSKNDVALQVVMAYLNVLLSDEMVKIAEQQVAISKQQLERIKKIISAGSANLGDQLNLESQLSQDASTLTARLNDYYLSQLKLKQLILIPADEEINLVKPIELLADTSIRLENTATVYGYAESIMPEIKRAEFSLLRWEKQMQASKGGRYPSLTLSGSIGTGYSGLRTIINSISQNGQEPIGFTETGDIVYQPTYDISYSKVAFGTQLSDNFNQFLGLSIGVPLFNQRNIQNSVNQARISRETARIQLDIEKQNLRQKIESARYSAIAAKSSYQSNIATLETTQKAFDFAKIRHEVGALNFTDFTNAKNNLAKAQAQLMWSRYDYLFKSKLLDFYMGKPLSM